MLKLSWTPRERLVLLVLSMVQIVHIVDFMILMPLGPILMKDLAITPAQFSSLVAGYGAAAAIAGLLASFVADRFDRKNLLFLLCLGLGFGTLGCAAANSFTLLFVARLSAGFFGGVLSSVIFSIVGDTFPPERRGHATGVVMGSFSLASIIGVPLGLAISNYWGWNAAFWFLAALIFGVMILGASVLPSMKGHLGHVQRPPWEIVTQDKNVFLALVFSFMTVFSNMLVIPFISPSLVANAGMRQQDLPVMYLVGGTISFFTSPWAGRLCDRRGTRWVFMIGGALSMGGFVAITHLVPMSIFLILLSSSFLFFSMSLRMVPAMTFVTGLVPPQKRGALLSLNSSVQQMAIALGSMVAGMIIEQGADGRLLHYEWTGYLAIAMTVVAMVLMQMLSQAKALRL